MVRESWRNFCPHFFIAIFGVKPLIFFNEADFGTCAYFFWSSPSTCRVAAAGLAHMSPLLVFFAVLLGRTAKYLPLCWMTAEFPEILKKLKIFGHPLFPTFH